MKKLVADERNSLKKKEEQKEEQDSSDRKPSGAQRSNL